MVQRRILTELMSQLLVDEETDDPKLIPALLQREMIKNIELEIFAI
jgi:hypothetical protein